MIRNYYYNHQLKKATIVFANIFAGMIVKTGMDGCGDILDIPVPIRYGSTDRVAGAIAASNTQNNLHTLPMMSVFLTNIAAAPDRQKGISTTDRRTYLPQGGVFPDDVKVIERVMPIPYNLSFELAIYASNADQAFQIIEQVLMLFDYEIQVQLNDAAFDWAKITCVRLDGDFRNDTNYPVGTDRQIMIWSASFTYETWISPPMNVRNDLIKTIHVNIGEMTQCISGEYDENGDLIPFDGMGTVVVGVGVGGMGNVVPAIDAAEPGLTVDCETTGLFNKAEAPCEAPDNKPGGLLG